MSLEIPNNLSDKAASFPESSYGANKVTFILMDGRRISEVYLAWGKEIVKIRNRSIHNIEDLDFVVSEISDVISEI
jgi:hypothetical protein